jgi:hypothetical protein
MEEIGSRPGCGNNAASPKADINKVKRNVIEDVEERF